MSLHREFRALDCMGAEVKVFRNLEKLVDMDIAIIRLMKGGSPACKVFYEVMGR